MQTRTNLTITIIPRTLVFTLKPPTKKKKKRKKNKHRKQIKNLPNKFFSSSASLRPAGRPWRSLRRPEKRTRPPRHRDDARPASHRCRRWRPPRGGVGRRGRVASAPDHRRPACGRPAAAASVLSSRVPHRTHGAHTYTTYT